MTISEMQGFRKANTLKTSCKNDLEMESSEMTCIRKNRIRKVRKSKIKKNPTTVNQEMNNTMNCL